MLPEVEVSEGVGATVRLYGYRELMAILVYQELREKNISYHLVARVLSYLRKEGYEQPLSELVFAVDGGQIYFQHPDGGWEGSAQARQGVASEVLNLDNIRARIAGAVGRPPDTVGQLAQNRRVLANAEHFAGTRIKVATVVSFMNGGVPEADILEAFPALTPADLSVAKRRLISA